MPSRFTATRQPKSCDLWSVPVRQWPGAAELLELSPCCPVQNSSNRQPLFGTSPFAWATLHSEAFHDLSFSLPYFSSMEPDLTHVQKLSLTNSLSSSFYTLQEHSNKPFIILIQSWYVFSGEPQLTHTHTHTHTHALDWSQNWKNLKNSQWIQT